MKTRSSGGRFRSRERLSSSTGQALVIFALVALVLLAFVALTVDSGFATVTQREEQTAADAASLDASVALIGAAPVPVAVFTMAQRIAQANGYSTNPTACTTSASATQTVYVFVDAGCAGGVGGATGFSTRVEVKVPPDKAQLNSNANCAVPKLSKYSCIQVTVDRVMPTTLEHIFGFQTVRIEATSVTYNPRALPAAAGAGGKTLFTPPVTCSAQRDGLGQDLDGGTAGAVWNGGGQPHWVTANPTQPVAGGPWVWTIKYNDEWPLHAYTTVVYTGAAASSGHYFSQGVWVNQASTTPPPNNAPGPDSAQGGVAPAASQDVGHHPATAAAGTFYTKTTTAPNLGGLSDWTAQFTDGSTLQINGDWAFGGTSNSNINNGSYSDTITFSYPAALVGAGGKPGFSLYLQDGDQCGDPGLWETLTPPSPPAPPPGPIMLDS